MSSIIPIHVSEVSTECEAYPEYAGFMLLNMSTTGQLSRASLNSQSPLSPVSPKLRSSIAKPTCQCVALMEMKRRINSCGLGAAWKSLKETALPPLPTVWLPFFELRPST